MKKTFHVVWTSFGTYQLWDNRGHWDEMHNKYQQLGDAGISIRFHYELPDGFLHHNPPINQRRFTSEQRLFIQQEINQLTQKDGDRMAVVDLSIELLHCDTTYVSLVVREEAELVQKKIARLKRRIATTLTSQYPSHFNGKSTWGKGIWISEIMKNTEQAISILKAPETHSTQPT